MTASKKLPWSYWPIMVVGLLFWAAIGGQVGHDLLHSTVIGIAIAVAIVLLYEAWSLRKWRMN